MPEAADRERHERRARGHRGQRQPERDDAQADAGPREVARPDQVREAAASRRCGTFDAHNGDPLPTPIFWPLFDQSQRITMSAPMKSSTSAWIVSERFPACSGMSKASGGMFREAVPFSECREHERRERDAERGVTAEQRDGDADEADGGGLDVREADREAPAEHVDRACEPGEHARDGHREEVIPRDGDASVAGRLGVEANCPDLVAERRPVDDDPERDERREGDEHPDVEALEDRVSPEDGT